MPIPGQDDQTTQILFARQRAEMLAKGLAESEGENARLRKLADEQQEEIESLKDELSGLRSDIRQGRHSVR